MFFNTDPALLPTRCCRGQEYGYINPYRLGWSYEEIALDLRDRAARRAQAAATSRFTPRRAASTPAARSPTRSSSSEVRGYLPLGSRVVVAGAHRVRPDLRRRATSAARSRAASISAGPDTHRGFNYNRLSLQIPSGLQGSPALPVGGDEMFLTQVELRVRAVARCSAPGWRLAGFVDAGDVAAPTGLPLIALDLARLHYAIGGGLRYKTLIGTIRADVGVRLNRSSADGGETARPTPIRDRASRSTCRSASRSDAARDEQSCDSRR